MSGSALGRPILQMKARRRHPQHLRATSWQARLHRGEAVHRGQQHRPHRAEGDHDQHHGRREADSAMATGTMAEAGSGRISSSVGASHSRSTLVEKCRSARPARCPVPRGQRPAGQAMRSTVRRRSAAAVRHRADRPSDQRLARWRRARAGRPRLTPIALACWPRHHRQRSSASRPQGTLSARRWRVSGGQELVHGAAPGASARQWRNHMLLQRQAARPFMAVAQRADPQPAARTSGRAAGFCCAIIRPRSPGPVGLAAISTVTATTSAIAHAQAQRHEQARHDSRRQHDLQTTALPAAAEPSTWSPPPAAAAPPAASPPASAAASARSR